VLSVGLLTGCRSGPIHLRSKRFHSQEHHFINSICRRVPNESTKTSYWLRHTSLSVRMQQLKNGWTVFQSIWCCGVLLKLIRLFQVWLETSNNNEYCACALRSVSNVTRKYIMQVKMFRGNGTERLNGNPVAARSEARALSASLPDSGFESRLGYGCLSLVHVRVYLSSFSY
jgi:hypothetical protein